MANPNAPFGLRPTRSLGRSNCQVNEYAHDSGDGTALFIGDPVLLTGSSTTGIAGIPDGTPLVIATGTITTTLFRGAVAGVRPTLTNLTLQYGLASTNYALLVYDDPKQLFAVQSDGTAAIGSVGANMSLTAGSGSTVTGLSAYVAHEATQATTVLSLRIMRVLPQVGIVGLAANGIYEVKIDAHDLDSQTGV